MVDFKFIEETRKNIICASVMCKKKAVNYFLVQDNSWCNNCTIRILKDIKKCKEIDLEMIDIKLKYLIPSYNAEDMECITENEEISEGGEM